MNDNIKILKVLIQEYEELCSELEEMEEDWNSGSPEAAAMSDPSDQFIKGMEIKEKYNEIKKVLEEL